MRRGHRARALLLLLALALVGCGDIGIDNMGEFVVTYKVTVDSDLPTGVLVSISTPDVKRQAIVGEGGLVATSFKPGIVTVLATDSGAWSSETESRARVLESGLKRAEDGATELQRMRDELLALHRARRETGPTMTCTWEVKPGPNHDGDNDLLYVVEPRPDGSVRLSGPGC